MTAAQKTARESTYHVLKQADLVTDLTHGADDAPVFEPDDTRWSEYGDCEDSYIDSFGEEGGE